MFRTMTALVYTLMATNKQAREVKRKRETTSPWFLSTTGVSPIYHIPVWLLGFDFLAEH